MSDDRLATIDQNLKFLYVNLNKLSSFPANSRERQIIAEMSKGLPALEKGLKWS